MGLIADLRRRFSPPAGARPIDVLAVTAAAQAQSQQSDAEQAAMAAALGAVVNQQAPLFSPGQPIAPAAGIEPAEGPRQFAPVVGYNIAQRPRSTEFTSFEKLRNLARLYDGIQMAEKAYFDIVRQLAPAIVPVDHTDDGDAAEMAAILAAFERPDGVLDLDDWVCAAMRDVLELDALSVYVRRSRKGELLGLDVIDGSTIKPLLDARGRPPAPPLPAYQQFLYGVPGGMYTSDQLLYRRENPRTDSPYGLSRVEMILLRVNQALRKQNYDLARFTDGNVPAGLLSVPKDDTLWTPAQIQEYEDMFNALLAGNDQARNRIKVLPPGFTYTPTAAADLMTPFDTLLLNITVAAFGLTMAELGFTETVNKSSGETQENVVYRRAVRPTARFIAAVFTRVIRLFWGPRYKFVWTGLEEEDKDALANRYAKLIPIGAASVDDYRAEVGLAKFGYPPFVITQGGGLVWLDDQMQLRKSQTAAQMAGYKLAQQNPAATQGPSAPNSQEQEQSDAKQPQPGPGKAESDTERAADLRRYQEVALKAVRAGKPVKAFDSTAIASDELVALREQLAACATAEQVRGVFAEAGRTANPLVAPALPKSQWFAGSARWKEPSKALLACEERLRELVARWLAGWEISDEEVARIVEQLRSAQRAADQPDPAEVPAATMPDTVLLVDAISSVLMEVADLGGQMSLDQLGITGTFDLKNPTAVQAIRDHAAQLVTGMTASQQADLAQVIADGVDQGLGPREIAQRMRREMSDLSKRRSELIARTETIRGLNGSLHESYKRNGVKLKAWDANPNACPICEANAGQDPIPMDEQFGDGSLFPPAHPGCRCSLWPTVSDEYVPGDWTGEDDVEEAPPPPTMQQLEDGIRKQTFETAIVIDPATGKEVLRKDGQTSQVGFTASELAMMKGNVLTHNHPSGWLQPDGSEGRIWGTSFSEADVATAAINELAEIRAVAPGVRYSLKPPSSGWRAAWWTWTGKPAYDAIEADVRRKFWLAINDGTLTPQEGNTRHSRTVLERWAASTGAQYSWEMS